MPYAATEHAVHTHVEDLVVDGAQHRCRESGTRHKPQPTHATLPRRGLVAAEWVVVATVADISSVVCAENHQCVVPNAQLLVRLRYLQGFQDQASVATFDPRD